MNSRALFTILSGIALLATSANCTMRQVSGSRDTGQSKLMDDTFAGQNACNPDDHNKPFIIEWDATDMSSFESLAAGDVVFVKYEGCSLKVLDECKNDSLRGDMGAYKPPEWTSGSLETINISNSGELHAKLPLGSATLGGRVSGGESFHMEYFVAGTRYASRDAVFESQLQDGNGQRRYGCEDANHFVYAYNLGAFALGSANELNIEGGASAFGFGAGGNRKSSHNAEKKGGDLAACQTESATEIAQCKAPIRLNLRKIRPGQSPEEESMAGPATAENMTAVAAIDAKLQMGEQAQGFYESAMAKFNAGDAKGCLAELTKHDKLDPKHKSSDPTSPLAFVRAQCVMASGKCDAGKVQYRKALEKSSANKYGPEQIDRTVDAMASMYCQGKMKPRDAVLKANNELSQAAYMSKKDSKFCASRYATMKKLLPKVKPKNDEDMQIINLKAGKGGLSTMVATCFQRAGDCKSAFKAYSELTANADYILKLPKESRPEVLRNGFEAVIPKCKGK